MSAKHEASFSGTINQEATIAKTIPHYYVERAVSGVIIRKLSTGSI